ncbi:hypothetical protein [Agromyces archimandritae]|uniref:Uncharacterized protein n=1 Tax=Agromyces archimandritae TaxID=2781962 RepID=A0A975FPQ8_9MICO|nr:hypothetical protein [Agromyces archimandritae]QTX05413.1 hypothetical protein G127AT_04110 [Agromyces archimandritae]
MGTALGTYTAKLSDGPLEGRTISTAFLESGDPRPRLEIPGAGKRYIYSRGAGLEYEDSGDRPSAVEYRFIETSVD